MKVCNLQSFVEAFLALPGADRPIEYDIGRPWHFNHSYSERQVDFAQDCGIYVYSRPGEPWDIPLDRNTQDVWYIGKSDGDLAGRVWAHVGPIYEPGSNEPCNPRFKHHQWAESKMISNDIVGSIACGNTVVYTLKVKPFGRAPGVAQALEKYLLACCFRINGELPPLNADL